MSKSRKVLAAILALVTVFCLCAGLAGCKKAGAGDDTQAQMENYAVMVKSQGGLPLEKVSVSVYADDTFAELKGQAQTDAEGKATIELPVSEQYAIALSDLPKGYNPEKSYSFSGTSAELKIASAPVTDAEMAEASLGLGDIAYDFSVETADGEKVTISEILRTKKMVLLNFWFEECAPSISQLRKMEQVYQQFKENAEIVVLSHMDTAEVMKNYQTAMGLSFPMGVCDAACPTAFGVKTFPTSIVIDRYGMISLVEAGEMNSLASIFQTFTAEDYTQKLYQSADEMVTLEKPTVEMDKPENVAAVLNNGEIPVTYHPETNEERAEFAWPFVAGEKNGEVCFKASNQGVDSSFSVIYADVTLTAGQAVGFDYLISSQADADSFVVSVDGEDIFTFSGYHDPEKWERCYPIVAEKDGTFQLALSYRKDDAEKAADDTVYIKNVRILDAKKIDIATYLPRQTAVSQDGTVYTYANAVFNKKDGYYHVGSENGPLLMADLIGITPFSQESSIWEMAYNGKLTVDGVNYFEKLATYAGSSNRSKWKVCAVNQELYELLQIVDKVAGANEEDTQEWLKACKYFAAYGTDGKQLADPVKGLAPHAAYVAKAGKKVAANKFSYDRAIMPKGLLAKFAPSKTGVYRITSRSESVGGVEGWIFDENRNALMTYQQDERLFKDTKEVSMVFYMEKGKSYYISIAFADLYEIGTISYDIEYVSKERDHFRLCSVNGVKTVLGSDGIYYVDIGDGKNGSKIYCDFTGVTGLLNAPIATKGDVVGLIDKGGFDFSKTADDQYVLALMAENGNDPEKTDAYLKELWGDSYELNYAKYRVEDVLAGKCHGGGADLTEQMRVYQKKMIKDGHKEREGCVVVTKELAEILQLLVDKYASDDENRSWLELCYYYDHLGPKS